MPHEGGKWKMAGLGMGSWYGGVSATSSGSGAVAGACGRPPGVLHKVNDQGLKMTCKVHRQCSCMITARSSPLERVMEDLAE